MRVAVVGFYPITLRGEGPDALRAALADGGAEGGGDGGIQVDISDYTDTKHAYLDPTTSLALAAACGASDEAGWVGGEERIGLTLGTSYGCGVSLARHAGTVATKGGRFASPFVFSHAYPNSPSSVLSIDLGLRGYNCCFVCGSVSGTVAVGAAFDQIRLGREERILAGGADAPPEGDAGSCFLALQEAESAARDGRTVSALILACGCGTDDSDRVVGKVLAEAGLSAGDLDGSIGNHPVSKAHRCLDEVYGCPGGAAGVLDAACGVVLAESEPPGDTVRRIAAVRRDASGMTGVVLLEMPARRS
jgi:3-oxoacyl-(acyl-carrier-protein) synthase